MDAPRHSGIRFQTSGTPNGSMEAGVLSGGSPEEETRIEFKKIWRSFLRRWEVAKGLLCAKARR